MSGIEFHLAVIVLSLVTLHLGWSEFRIVRDAGEAAKQAQARRHARKAAEADRVANAMAARALRSGRVSL